MSESKKRAPRRTPRGFSIYSEFSDSKNQRIRVQESSLAGGPYCWVFANNADGQSAYMHMGQPQSVSPHLSRAQARRLAKALLKFADGAE